MKAFTEQFQHFVSTHSTDREERLRFFVFFAGALQLIMFTTLNLTGCIGILHPFLQMVSFTLLGLCILMVVLYLRRKLSLTAAFSIFAIAAQFIEMVRIGFHIIYKPVGYETMVVYYQVGSFTILLYLTLGFIPKIPLVVTIMNILIMVTTILYDDAAISRQIASLFILLCLFTCALAYVSQRAINSMQKENKDYEATQNSILKAFNMSQNELIAYLKLCRTKDPDSNNIEKLLSQLNEQSKHNLILAAMVLKKKRDAQHMVLSNKFPTLTRTELEVARLVVEGKTLSEIALIMSKTTSNISTVRGNIRKKMSLQQNDNLEEKLQELSGSSSFVEKKVSIL